MKIFVVMDEADRILNMDFEVEVTKILRCLPKERRTMLFSATMTKKVAKLQRASLKVFFWHFSLVFHPNTTFSILESDFNVKFPLLRLLQFLSDLKSTILSFNIFYYFSSCTHTRFVKNQIY